MPSVTKRSDAERDLEGLAFHIGQTDTVASTRFLAAAERTFAVLASMPEMAAPYPLTNPRLQGMKRHPVQGFPNHLVFYLPTPLGIEVVRVLHGARNVARVMEGQP